MRIYLFLIFILFLQFAAYSQEMITINHADSLIGRIENGEQIREAIGNVDIIHNNLHITAQHAIHYTAQNKAELYGNVRVVKDTLTITCPAGIYNGNEGKVYCPRGATLNDSKVTLIADYGEYTFSTDVANFRGNVRIFDSETYVITSNELDYYRNQSRSDARGNVKIETDSAIVYSDKMTYEQNIRKVVSEGNVKIESDSTIINTDKLTYFEQERRSIAEGNVKADFIANNAIVYGNEGEYNERTNYSIIRGNSRLIQIDKKPEGDDTVYIYSRQLEAFRNIPEYYVATDSVEIIRNEFLSRAGLAYYYKAAEGEGGVMTLSKVPVVWHEELQVTGDSIFAYFRDELDKIYVHKSAFAFQQIKDHEDRFDQISGVYMQMNFIEGNIDYIRVDTNAASIYYIFENELPNGLNNSDGDIITLNFKDDNVTKVKIQGDANGKYFPELFIKQAEQQLPGFHIRADRPQRRIITESQ